MHRAAASVAAPLLLAVHLGHYRPGRDSTNERMAMFAIGGHDRIVGLQRLHRSHGDRFLTYVEMEKPANFSGAVEFRTLFFEAADTHHLAEKQQRMIMFRARSREVRLQHH